MTAFSLDCPYCGIKNTGFTSQYKAQICEQINVKTDFFLAVATCNMCGNGVVTRWSADTKPNWLPKPAQTETPKYCPDEVTKAFKEGCDVLSISTASSVLMFRKTVELSLKKIHSENLSQNLKQRIKTLANNHTLTKTMSDWADHVRLEGNVAAHELEEPTKKQAEDLREFTRYLLTYLFTLPEKIKRIREGKTTLPTHLALPLPY